MCLNIVATTVTLLVIIIIIVIGNITTVEQIFARISQLIEIFKRLAATKVAEN